MSKLMKIICIFLAALLIVFSMLFYFIGKNVFLTMAITFGITFYHFFMRLVVGFCYDKFMHNNVNYKNKFFYPNKIELKIYGILKVKQWKKYIPTYDKNAFDLTKHTNEEIAMTMCQSQLVHITIMILSYIPIICVIFFNSFLIFFYYIYNCFSYRLCFCGCSTI